jgi:hypothetical protein
MPVVLFQPAFDIRKRQVAVQRIPYENVGAFILAMLRNFNKLRTCSQTFDFDVEW